LLPRQSGAMKSDPDIAALARGAVTTMASTSTVLVQLLTPFLTYSRGQHHRFLGEL
jgi:hypothetical protein